MRYRLILVILVVAVIFALLLVQRIGVEWLWVMLNGVMQHELR
jgi:hypothetical protein